MIHFQCFTAAFLALSFWNPSMAQNPFIMDQFTADPSARVFEGRLYVYPSHDIPCGEGQGFIGFCMADYHVFSSDDLVDWKDHGVILDQGDVPWVDSTSYSMWAPDCIYRDGKYYFYFPARKRDRTVRGGQAIGVAVSDRPYGPFVPQPEPIEGMLGIDPNPFIDKDGQAYIYWGGGEHIQMARLKDNMLELASDPGVVRELPPKFKEGAYLFERKGIYYFTFPHKENDTERLAYAMGEHPLGPFTYKGVIMDESSIGCWTNHHSIVEFKGQWYLFYHHNDLSPEFDKNRSIRVDSLFFNADGTIRKVTPTWRGVGITGAGDRIQVDRYSQISGPEVYEEYLDDQQRSLGWKLILTGVHSWSRYNRVDFGRQSPGTVVVKARSTAGGILEFRTGDSQDSHLATMEIPATGEWTEIRSPMKSRVKGIRDLVVSVSRGGSTEVDWVTFQ